MILCAFSCREADESPAAEESETPAADESETPAADESETPAADETLDPKDKSESKEKSSVSRRGNRFHPYKDKLGGVGDKKSVHRNRVFISNIPYDMKWQSIKDLMREKGNFSRG